MQLRLIEAILPATLLPIFNQWSEDKSVVERWDEQLNNDKALVRMLVDAVDVEALLDGLVSQFSQAEGFRVMLIPVEATLPRPVEEEKPVNGDAEKTPERVNREEIYNLVSEGANISNVYIAQVLIATVVAAIGLMRNDTAIVIGAMVIAPLLGPNMSLSLATTLGDKDLAIRSLKANAVGLSLALVSCLAVGFVFTIDATQSSIDDRTQVSGGDIILALGAGCVGVLAFTLRAPSALIGVMVAVALLPPFAVFGLLLASGDFQLAIGAALLTATNLICVNLAGVLTFYVQGLRPHSWWEAKRAKRATIFAIIIWIALHTILFSLIYFDWNSFAAS